MTTVSELIDNTYDAVTMMRISAQILSEGEVSQDMAGELSWMLGSCKKRLEDVINALEIMDHARSHSSSTPVAKALDNLEDQLSERRVQAERKGRAS